MAAFTLMAAYSGTCPCGAYIRAGVSTVARLEVPLPPDPAVCWYSGERGQWFIRGATGHIKARRWLHAKCAAKLDGLSFDDLELLAADRRAELQAMKRRGDDDAGRRHGRQRAARAKVTSS